MVRDADGSNPIALAFNTVGGMDEPSEAMLYDVASGEVSSLGTSLWITGWSPDSRSLTSGENGVAAVVGLSDPSAPVVTEVEDLNPAFMPVWQPLP